MIRDKLSAVEASKVSQIKKTQDDINGTTGVGVGVIPSRSSAVNFTKVTESIVRII